MSEPELFSRGKRTEQCLSAWTLSRAELGLLDAAGQGAAAAHIATCESCAMRAQAEFSARRAAALETIPEALRQGGQPRFGWLRVGIGFAGFASAAAVAVLVLTTRTTERTKGEVAVSISVQRDGRLVVDDEPAERVVRLEADDLLRIKLSSGRFVRLETLEGTEWRLLFAGARPAGDWLPIGLRVTPDEPIRLRVSACESETAACEVRMLAW